MRNPGAEPWPRRLAEIGIGLVLLALARYFIGLDWRLVGVIGAIIVIAGCVSGMWGKLIGAAGWLVTAGVIYFVFGQTRAAALVGVIGVISVVMAISEMRSFTRPTGTGGR